MRMRAHAYMRKKHGLHLQKSIRKKGDGQLSSISISGLMENSFSSCSTGWYMISPPRYSIANLAVAFFSVQESHKTAIARLMRGTPSLRRTLLQAGFSQVAFLSRSITFTYLDVVMGFWHAQQLVFQNLSSRSGFMQSPAFLSSFCDLPGEAVSCIAVLARSLTRKFYFLLLFLKQLLDRAGIGRVGTS